MHKLLILISLISLLCWKCGPSDQQNSQASMHSLPVVYVSNFPLYSFARRIGGGYFDIRFPMSGSGDPSYWQPNPDTIASMQKADLILLNGASYEKWLMNVSLPVEVVVNTSRGFVDRLLESHETFTHSHGEEGAHEHKGTASYTWMDLTLAILQAKEIEQAMINLVPKYTSMITENHEALKKDLLQLHEQFLAVGKQAPFVLYSHPVFQYFQKAYGVEGESLHWEPDDKLNDAMLTEVEDYTEIKGRLWLVWEHDPMITSIEILDEQGIRSIIVRPGGGQSTPGDYIDLIKRNLQSLQNGLENDQ